MKTDSQTGSFNPHFSIRAANLKCFTSIIYKYADENKQPTWTWNK